MWYQLKSGMLKKLTAQRWKQTISMPHSPAPFFRPPNVFIDYIRIYAFSGNSFYMRKWFRSCQQKCYIPIWYHLDCYLCMKANLEFYKTVWTGQQMYQVADNKDLNWKSKETARSQLMTPAWGNNEINIQNENRLSIGTEN